MFAEPAESVKRVNLEIYQGGWEAFVEKSAPLKPGQHTKRVEDANSIKMPLKC